MASCNLNICMNVILSGVNSLRSRGFAESNYSYEPDSARGGTNILHPLVRPRRIKQLYSIGIFAFVLVTNIISRAQTPQDAITLEQQGKLDDATRAWQAITRRDPNDAAAFASLGVVLSKQ